MAHTWLTRVSSHGSPVCVAATTHPRPPSARAQLTFQLVTGLLLLNICLAVLGVLMMRVPWGFVVAWSLRLIGVAAFGPHMRHLGKRVRTRWSAFVERSAEFDAALPEERQRILSAYADECEKRVRQVVHWEMYGGELPEVSEELGRQSGCCPRCVRNLGGVAFLVGRSAGEWRASRDVYDLESKYPTITLRPQPTSGKLRFLHRPDPMRSYAYPSFPAEDRPTLHDASAPAESPTAVLAA